MLKRVVVGGLLILLLVGCSASADVEHSPTPLPASQTPLPTETETPRPTRTPAKTPTPTLMPTATIVPTPTWPVTGPGEVVAPILMYHRVNPEKPATRYSYNVHPEQFAEQMQFLDDLGYQTITARQLIAAIKEGAPLPPRPIVITFDDGHISVYEYAFPIMQAHGFIGVSYIVANRLEAEGFIGVPELEEMIAAGWEIGSHSYTHTDLTIDHSTAYNEIFLSREHLDEALSENVDTFAFPFGSIDQYLGGRIRKWGYSGAMGLGWSYTHSPNSIFYLSRLEIFGDYDLETFTEKLPWTQPAD